MEAQKRLEAYFSTLDLSINPEIGLLLEDASYWDFQYKQGLQRKPGYEITEEEKIKAENRRKAFAMRGSYLLMKEDMKKVVEGMLQTRATLDGTYQVLLNRCDLMETLRRQHYRLTNCFISMIVDEIREQRTMFEIQSQSLSKQRAMITHIMGALNLKLPVDSTSKDSTSVGPNPKAELPLMQISVDMSEMYLRPLGEEDEDRPCQKVRNALRHGRPPVCVCCQSHTSNQSGNPHICSDSSGEAYFDLEEGLWLKPCPPGTKVYFDQDEGIWLIRQPAGPSFPIKGYIGLPFMLRLKRTFGLRKRFPE